MITEIKSWFSNIRFYILLFSVVLSIVEYLVVAQQSESRGELVHTITSAYAFTAVIFLYFALLAGPFTKMASWFPWRSQYIQARRAIGVSAFYFSVLHVRYSFFDVLGGLEVILQLPLLMQFGVLLGIITLIILFLLAATSFDKAVDTLGFNRWKSLHQWIYLAGFAVVIHATIMGANFADKTAPIALLTYIASAFLVGLHVYGLYKKRQLMKKRTV